MIKSNLGVGRDVSSLMLPGHSPPLREVRAGAQGRKPEAGTMDGDCLLAPSGSCFPALDHLLGDSPAHSGMGSPPLINSQDNPPQTCPQTTRLLFQVVLGCVRMTVGEDTHHGHDEFDSLYAPYRVHVLCP